MERSALIWPIAQRCAREDAQQHGSGVAGQPLEGAFAVRAIEGGSERRPVQERILLVDCGFILSKKVLASGNGRKLDGPESFVAGARAFRTLDVAAFEGKWGTDDAAAVVLHVAMDG